MAQRARFYIDGFNLYYGALKGTPWRWLDLGAMCGALVRGLSVDQVHYFTARVRNRPDDPMQSQRQDDYLRALATRPVVRITLGKFAQRHKYLPTTASIRHPPIEMVSVQTEEEKGSDVNLGSWLLHDAHEDRYDTAVIISNDSDLQTPVDLAIGLGQEVLIVNPHRHGRQKATLVGTRAVKLRRWHLANHQLGDAVITATGTVIVRPDDW